MRTMKKILSVLIVLLMLQLPPVANSEQWTATATGSNSAVTVEWQPHPQASFYQIRKTNPVEEALWNEPFFANEWTDSDCITDKIHAYRVTALDSSLNRIYEYPEVTAKLDAKKPTLSSPCNKTLAFTINQKRYTVDGKAEEMSTAPIIKGGRSFLVIRYIVEPIKGEIGWEGSTKKITITAMGHEIQMWIGKSTALVDGVETPIDPNNSEIAPFISNGRTLVPLRFPVEALGTGDISWFGDTKTAVLTFPMGCEKTAKGTVTETGMGFFKLDTSLSGSKKFEINGTSPFLRGTCVSVSYQEFSSGIHIGRMLKIPCKTPCEGQTISGKIKNISGNSIVITDDFGFDKTFTLSKSILAPAEGQCISGCVSGDILTGAMITACPTTSFVGKVEKLNCSLDEVMMSSEGKTLKVIVPPLYPCSSLIVGNCYKVEGIPSIFSPGTVTAEKITPVPCGKGQEFQLFAQDYCKDNKVKAQDIEGNEYLVEIPPGLVCSAIKPGSYMVVNGLLSGKNIFATTSSLPPAPKDENYNRGVITSISPLKITVPAGKEIIIKKPAYYGGELSIGLGLEFWGILDDNKTKAVRLEITKDYPEELSGRIIGAVCQENKLFLINETGKSTLLLPENVHCDEIKTGTCVELFGVSNGDEFKVASLTPVECETDCIGETFEGVITFVDCAEGQIKIMADSEEITVSLTADVDCSTLSVGTCLTVCGHIEDGIIKPQIFVVEECSEPDCIDEAKYGIITSLDCETKEIELATESGTLKLNIPPTTNCQSLAISDCVQFCGVSYKSVEYLKNIDCNALGDVLSGIVTEIRDDGILIATDDGTILLSSENELKVGECIKAVGTLTGESFEADFVAVTPCTGSAVIQGEITNINCWEKTIQIKTLSRTETVSVGEDFDCNKWDVGDCVISQKKENGVQIESVDCPENITDTLQIVVTGYKSGQITGVTLDTMRLVKIQTEDSWNIGDILNVDAHRIDAKTFDNAECKLLPEKIKSTATKILTFDSWNPDTKICYLTDKWGGKHIAVSPEVDFKDYKTDDSVGIDMTVIDGGLNRDAYIITDSEKLTEKEFLSYKVVGIIIGVDTVDEVILLHTHDGDNITISPADKAVLKTLKTGDCAITRGELNRENHWLTGASIEASDCMGGEIGRQFTGVAVGIDAIAGRLQVSSDNGDLLYTVWLEAVSQLTGLSLGDCVSVSGVLIKKDDESNLMGRTVTRIDCVAEANKPVQIEGKALQVDEDAGYVRIQTIDKSSWKAFLAETADLKGIKNGDTVRCSGRLQAKKGVISKAFVTAITPPTFYWSVSGEVTATEENSFVLKDNEGRDWKMTGSKTPTAGDNVLAVGILPPDGFATLVDVNWISTKDWDEPRSNLSGVVFGLSCGMDNLLIRNKFGLMTSVRLPKTGFCGYFTTGECVDMKGRLMANIPGMAKVTSVSQSEGLCYEREITGRILSRSTVDKIAIILTTDGRRIRMSFETEGKCVRAEVGGLYRAKGRFMPYAPDTLKVDSLKRTGELGSYSSNGIVVGLWDEGFYLITESFRTVKVKTPAETALWTGLVGSRVQVKGSINLESMVTADEITMASDKKLAVEMVGSVKKVGVGYVLLEEKESKKLWRVEVSGDEIPRGEVFVAGWLVSERVNEITGAKLIPINNEPTTQMLIWGVVKSTDCDKNIVEIQLDDSSVYEVHSGYYGQCETFTPGEMVQIVGLIQPRSGKVIVGARMLRPGLVGDRKVIVGVITEISCTSRIIKLQEDNRGDIPGSLWTVQLEASVDCNELEIGERVKIEGDPVASEKYFLEDATINTLSQKTREVTVQGILVTIDCKENMMILKSEGRYYRVIPADPKACEGMVFAGDELKVTATISSNRKTILKNATWKKIPDKKAYMLLHGWVDVASCPKIRFYTHEEEFWKINIEEGTDPPCDKLTRGSKVTLKGLKDLSQDHLMHHAMIYNYMKKTVFVGIIDEINCATGQITIDRDTAKQIVHVETEYDDCLQDRFSKGDVVEITGWYNHLYPGSPVYFADLEKFGNSAGQVPVDFVAEVLINPDCGKNEIQVASSHVVWRVRLPDNFDCKSIGQGDWIHITGGIESWNEKIILSERVEKSSAQLFGSVVRADYSKSVLYVLEIVRDIQWSVSLSDPGKTSTFKIGDYMVIDGNSSGSRSITNGVARKLTKIEGVVEGFDLVSQAVIIKGTDRKRYKAKAKTDWINVNEFKVNKGIYAVGTKLKEKEKDGTIILENCYIEHDMGFDPKNVNDTGTHEFGYQRFEMCEMY